MLEHLKKSTKYSENRKVLRNIDNVEPLYDIHEFWDSQPVPKAYEKVDESMYDKPIDVEKTVADIKPEPYTLPPGYTWSIIDISNREEAKEVYDLLTQNYVEDDDNMFRFDYSIEFLQWALTPPGYYKDWLFGVRGGKKNKLFGFISGIPVDSVVRGKHVKMAEINFLCVHKSLRTKRLATVLIKEVTRRVNLLNIWQAIYTAGVLIPLPISKTTYWHRSLNPKKLVEVGFSSLPAGTPMARYLKLLKLPTETSIKGLREMQKGDVKVVHELLNAYLSKFEVHLHFTEAEVAHFLLPRPGVVDTYVVENPQTKEIKDFLSFYHLPSSILKHEVHKTLNVAYCYYNVANTVSMEELIRNALIIAKQKDFDVFNALDILDNETLLKELKFGIGDGNLHYYFYNWRVPEFKPSQIGIVLV
jgi:glycylpeptide N-tetradecanoyltransferase